MRRASETLLAAAAGVVCLLLVPTPAYAQAPGRPLQRQAPGVSASTPSPQQTFLNRYCVRCHNDRRLTAGLALNSADLSDVGGGAMVWERVVRKLRGGVMPPAGQPRPEQAAREEFVSWLEAGLDRAAAAAPNPGRNVHPSAQPARVRQRGCATCSLWTSTPGCCFPRMNRPMASTIWRTSSGFLPASWSATYWRQRRSAALRSAIHGAGAMGPTYSPLSSRRRTA